MELESMVDLIPRQVCLVVRSKVIKGMATYFDFGSRLTTWSEKLGEVVHAQFKFEDYNGRVAASGE